MRIKQVDPLSWYDIPGYEGKYQINYFGIVRRTYKNGTAKELHAYVKKSNRRSCVHLNQKEYVVMKLMTDTFWGKLKDGYCTYHKNGILSDNVLSNIGIATKSKLGKITGTNNGCSTAVVKIDQNGQIVDFYKSAREAGRENYMSYQAILDRVNGKVKSLFAPDGFVYIRDKDSVIEKARRRIELKEIKESGIPLVEAPKVQFDF